MQLTLIVPASGLWAARKARGRKNGKWFRFSLLSVLTVAAATPPGWEIEIIDEQVDDVDLDAPRDLVGITAMTATAPRAYQLCAEFRRRGVPVVLGGMHPTFLPDEAGRHADAVVLGEAEGIWPRLLADFRAGRLQPRYGASEPFDLSQLPRLPRHLVPRRPDYVTLNTVECTRGCPHRCQFCSIAAFHSQGQRQRPVASVIDEVSRLRGRNVMLIDDNLAGNRRYARELFTALAPLGKRWISQTTLDIADDPALVALAAASGCHGFFVGLETLSTDNLADVRKQFNRADQFKRQIDVLHRHRIGVETGIVVGLDHDRPDVFERTLRFTDEAGIDAVQVAVMTPLPGTPLFARMQHEGRIFDHNWEHYDYRHVVVHPRGMTPDELQAGADWLISEFYSPRRIARRVVRALPQLGLSGTLLFSLPINLAYWNRVRSFDIAGHNPTTARDAAPQGREAYAPTHV